MTTNQQFIDAIELGTSGTNSVAVEKSNMVKDGLLRDDSSWGIWEITEKGVTTWRDQQKAKRDQPLTEDKSELT